MKIKSLIIGMCVGIVAGAVIVQIPAVKQAMTTGKNKLKQMLQTAE